MGKLSEREGEIQASGEGMEESPDQRQSIGNIVNDIVIALYGDGW